MSGTFRILGLWLVSAFAVQAQRVGDTWETKRGDSTPDFRYSAATRTTTGRLIAVSDGGGLMFSDNGGGDWSFGQIEVGGFPVRGSFSTIYQVPGSSLIAVMRTLEESEVGNFSHYVQTWFLASNDNGNTWTRSAFTPSAARARSGKQYYGVNITGLRMGPGGQLLAYGSTSGTSSPGFILWNIGGVIFRQSGGTWVQALFDYGPVGKIADAGGRAVAACYNAVLDSADGSGWNGYVMGASQIKIGGELLAADIRARLRVTDLEVVDGTHIAQAATFLPFNNLPNVDTPSIDKIYKISSPTPFSGSRNWTAFPETKYFNGFTRIGPNIAAFNGSSAYYTSGGGAGYTLAEAGLAGYTPDVAVVDSTTAWSLESSRAVWRTTNSGASWIKIRDEDAGPDLRLIGEFHGNLFARANNTELWISRDKGDSWQRHDVPSGFSAMLQGGGDRLIATKSGTAMMVSDDKGLTWTERAISTGGVSPFLMVRTPTGRIILPLRGRSSLNRGVFLVSDDNGETFAPRNAGLAFGEEVRAAVTAASGRILVATNSFARFDPELNISDDNGESWRSSTVLRSTEGLDAVAGDPSSKVIQFTKMRLSTSGRLVALGHDELLTSDDDGATWGFTPFETKLRDTYLDTLAISGGNRLVISGGNAAVFTSEFDPPMPAGDPVLTVREGSTEMIPVSRPDVDGAVSAFYTVIEGTAKAGVDFTKTGGALTWADGDTTDRAVPIEAIDNTTTNGPRVFTFRLVFETADGLVGTVESPVAITDDDTQIPDIVFPGPKKIYTSETGDSVLIRFALRGRPSENVTVRITGLDPTEGSLSGTTFLFTPADWSQLRSVTLTGLDDPLPDVDSTYDLDFEIESTDRIYSVLTPVKIGVTNLGDEPYRPIVSYGQWAAAKALPAGMDGPQDDPNGDGVLNLQAYALGTAPLGTTVGPPLSISAGGEITFSVPDSVTGVTFASELSPSLDTGNWTPGPVPVPSLSQGGRTQYRITLPASIPARFARIIFILDP